MKEIGTVVQLFRYPVKSMAGQSIDAARLGWHGLHGDRRFAIRKVNARTGFPWLTAGSLNELIRYQPVGSPEADAPLPTHVRTPDGVEIDLYSDDLRDLLSARHGDRVELVRLDHGIFDEAPVSVICGATIRGVEREAGRPLDVRRFRPNVLVETPGGEPFQEDAWVGKTLVLGDEPDGPALTATLRDVRCAMLNLDPESAEKDARVMKATVRLNGNCAGVYGTVVREGQVRVGQTVWLKE